VVTLCSDPRLGHDLFSFLWGWSSPWKMCSFNFIDRLDSSRSVFSEMGAFISLGNPRNGGLVGRSVPVLISPFISRHLFRVLFALPRRARLVFSFCGFSCCVALFPPLFVDMPTLIRPPSHRIFNGCPLPAGGAPLPRPFFVFLPSLSSSSIFLESRSCFFPAFSSRSHTRSSSLLSSFSNPTAVLCPLSSS